MVAPMSCDGRFPLPSEAPVFARIEMRAGEGVGSFIAEKILRERIGGKRQREFVVQMKNVFAIVQRLVPFASGLEDVCSALGNGGLDVVETDPFLLLGPED